MKNKYYGYVITSQDIIFKEMKASNLETST